MNVEETPVAADGIWRCLLPAIAAVVCVLVYLYGTHMDRFIPFDEIGLHNPVYTYFTTGRMTYPLHGHAEYMVVHPPTHYLLTALAMKVGAPLFAASAAPIVLLTVILAVVLLTGPLSPSTSAAVLIAYFASLTTWSEFYTLRPDLHVTAAWFTGLVTLEVARASGWSPARLFLGSAISVLAASVHYWGVTALLLPVCYAALVVKDRGLAAARVPLVAIAAGGCMVGVPFLVWFVLPYYGPIIEMVQAVQGDGTPMDALARHLRSYDSFAQRLTGSFDLRGLSSGLASPALLLRIPAVFIAVPILAAFRDTRGIGLAGAVLPLFVLFLSQGKQVGYTGYFTPEFTLLFLAGLVLVFKTLTAVSRRSRWVTQAAAAVLAGWAFIGVPTSMGFQWSWTRRLDTLDVLRGAALRVVGPEALVAVTSAGVWYTGGGTVLWNAFNEIAAANQRGEDMRTLLAPIDAVVLDTNWWNARADLAPLGTWFLEGTLQLSGFVLPNDPTSRHMMHLFLVPRAGTRVRGIFIEGGEAREFVESFDGNEAFTVLACSNTPAAGVFKGASYSFQFAYDREPAPKSPSIVLLGSTAAAVSDLVARAGVACRVKESRRGSTTSFNAAFLRTDPARERPIRIFSDRSEALKAAERAETVRLGAERTRPSTPGKRRTI